MFNQYLILMLSFLGTLILAAPYPNLSPGILATREAGRIETRGITGEVECETTTGSPRISDINGLITYIDKERKYSECVQGNIGSVGSKCRTLLSEGTAVIEICGHFNFHVMCYDAAEAARRIVKDCAWKGLAGGQFWFDNTPLRIQLTHT